MPRRGAAVFGNVLAHGRNCHTVGQLQLTQGGRRKKIAHNVFRLRCYRVVAIKRVVGVADLGTAKESGTVIRIQWQVAPQTFRQIGVGDEVATECDEVSVARLEDRFGSMTFEAASGDDGALVVLTDQLRGDGVWILAVIVDVPEYSWLDKVQVGQVQFGQLLRHVSE